MISKLSAGDVFAQEAKYYKDCLTALYNKVRNNSDEAESKEGEFHGEIAFAELVAYIDELDHFTSASTTCRELLKCSCKNIYQAKCRCPKAGLSCTALCSCGSKCRSPDTESD
jgi:hypothetical protein